MTEHILPQPKKNPLFKLMESKIFWTLSVLTLFSLPLIRSLQKEPVETLPVYSQIEDFKLINQDGRTITSQEFTGSVLLVNFVFTRCPGVCPLMTQQMAKVQERLKGTAKNIQLVSISVDPEFDKPQILKAYATKHNADLKIWSFLTGDFDTVKHVVVDNFKTPLDPSANQNSDNLMDIAHAEQFVLVDQIGQIRGYRTLKNKEDINNIVKDLAILVNTFPPKKKI